MSTATTVRSIGGSIGGDGRYSRCAERWVIHGELSSFQALCQAAVPVTTRTIVLDMDRTLHLGRNLGELVGWELGALSSYGSERLSFLEAARGEGRFLWDAQHPWQMARYLARGARAWAYAGSFYYAFGKLAQRVEAARRFRNGLFGADPYGVIQEVPLLALLHEFSDMPLEAARALSRQVIERLAPDQVVDREAVSWLREHCPGVRIVLSSASPQPVVEAAAELLGVEACQFSEIDVVNGRMTSPYDLSSAYLHDREPPRITRPSGYRRNAGHAKIGRLHALLGDHWNDGRDAVGITDTWYGEDHCWAHHFERVIDLNSRTPFAPVVAHDSPLREVHSAQVLTAAERARRAAGEAEYLNPLRQSWQPRAPRVWLRAEIEAQLAPLLKSLEAAAADYARVAGERAPGIAEADASVARAEGWLTHEVERYNESPPTQRRERLAGLAASVRAHTSVVRSRRRIARPVSLAAFDVTELVSRASEECCGETPLPLRASHLAAS